ncbi:membrane dipeptidase, partial [Micrococcus sp. SIMBA_131]
FTCMLGDWYTYENTTTPGFESMAGAGSLRDALTRRGYGEDAVDKIMRDNLLRVYEEVWGE